ncbi:hypothetical protein [Thiomonas sp.]|jgi:hypothetical protein|uniref:hypothetical protein n=1 Tax=Thiomonas sp. TaxID=2047785 RepID=UPI001771C560|nr:hypothetical protein [Thiomonas sp.]
MSDNTDSLILEHLRHIRMRVEQIADDPEELKNRMSSLEGAFLNVKRELVHCAETDARQQLAIDRIMQRLERIERRLELS